ncbi:hypothetical protein ACFQHV_07270 [Promicromonospora thailandica]|uniref:Uncharacterized protein n=1 Tax=Promicromonospora thailandica TaxID=765201 RepID=A0A9X2JX27_9MICO|nr:hypothetical protein [Promicromonospora thailandica]MCP2267240.1 hypothetical protein [Promicromonospora thailandica]BFF17451.1 hypothetical protein GCM10025730_09720 [Promicromonospora thailandica]
MTRPVAWRTAVFEGAGALLWWDLGTGEGGEDVWDAARTAGWLDAPRDTMRRVALDAWRAAWWPASRVADVAPLDPRVLCARRAVALAALDGITDDDEAVERALRELAAHEARLGPLEEAAVGPLAARVREVADDHGLAGTAPDAPPRREDLALAAGGTPATGDVLMAGDDRVDPGAVPQGVADPLGRIAWQVGAALTVAVTVPAAPVAGDPEPVVLTAVADGVTVPLHRAGDAWWGEVPAPPALLTSRPVFRLVVPGFAAVPGVDARRLVEIAREVGP